MVKNYTDTSLYKKLVHVRTKPGYIYIYIYIYIYKYIYVIFILYILHLRCMYTAANDLTNNIIVMLLQVHDFE